MNPKDRTEIERALSDRLLEDTLAKRIAKS
jgi:hypothetical protein